MRRVPGQITRRLPVSNPDADAWTYQSPEETTDARAADGYRLGSRWHTVRRIQRRRRRAALIQAAVLAVLCGGSIGALGITELRTGSTDWWPKFAYVGTPPEGVSWCRAETRADCREWRTGSREVQP